MESITVKELHKDTTVKMKYQLPLKVTSDGEGVAVLLSIKQYNQLVQLARKGSDYDLTIE